MFSGVYLLAVLTWFGPECVCSEQFWSLFALRESGDLSRLKLVMCLCQLLHTGSFSSLGHLLWSFVLIFPLCRQGYLMQKGVTTFFPVEIHFKRNSSGRKEKNPFKIIPKQILDVLPKQQTGSINFLFLNISTVPLKLNKQPQIYFLGGICELELINRIFRINYM